MVRKEETSVYSVRFYNEKGHLYAEKCTDEPGLISKILVEVVYDDRCRMYKHWLHNRHHYEVWRDGQKLVDSRKGSRLV